MERMAQEPRTFKELVEADLRRAARLIIRVQDEVDPQVRIATPEGDYSLAVTLPREPRERLMMMRRVVAAPGVVKTRYALLDAAYDDQVYVDDRTIDRQIGRLRKKFKRIDSEFNVIETLPGVGYRFKE